MPRIAAWNDASSEEDARAYLQGRLRVLSRLLFWSYAAFIGGLTLLYNQYPKLRPEWNGVIFTTGLIGLVILAVIWRLVLARRTCSMTTLNRVDAFYAIASGLLFGIGGVMAVDFKPAPYGTLLYACLTVLSRAIVVPSTPRRTLELAALSFAPFVAASVVISVNGWFTDMPPAALICAVTVICIVVALLAATGSKTTYGLRLEARAAMRLGQYTLDRKIGQGGMGTVYIASHALLRRPTAIKLLQPERVGAENVDRFEREVQHMSQLTHPNTVAVFDYGRSPDGVFYYAMEYLDGIDLEKLVHRDGAQSPSRVAMILVQVCGALNEAHTKGLVHRDIKPANIILCERGAAQFLNQCSLYAS